MKIIFTGDVCVKNEINDISISKEIEDEFNDATYSFACFEAPWLKENKNYQPIIKIGPNLSQKKGIKSIVNLFTHVSIANNHIMDFGLQGCLDTIEILKKHNVISKGAGESYNEIYEPLVIENGKLKIGVFCWGEAQFGCYMDKRFPFGYAWILNPQNIDLIRTFKNKLDYIIIYAHAGLENADLPLEEWRMAYRSFIDNGADLVIGGHPHCIQGKEEYNGKFIYYSLGNFFFNSKNNEDWNTSILVKVIIEDSKLITQEIFVERANNKIIIANERTQQKFLELSELLTTINTNLYKNKLNAQLLNHWERYYESFYSYPKRNYKLGLKARIINFFLKRYIDTFYYKPQPKQMLYHNINVDTHRFVTLNVLRLLTKTY